LGHKTRLYDSRRTWPRKTFIWGLLVGVLQRESLENSAKLAKYRAFTSHYAHLPSCQKGINSDVAGRYQLKIDKIEWLGSCLRGCYHFSTPGSCCPLNLLVSWFVLVQREPGAAIVTGAQKKRQGNRRSL
jgi:hypothetical protein